MKKHLATMFALLSALGFTQALAASYTTITSETAAELRGATGGDIVRQVETAGGGFDCGGGGGAGGLI